MEKSQEIIDFQEIQKKRNKEFAKYVHSELMLDLLSGEVDAGAVYDLLTEQGKKSVQIRLNGGIL